MFKKKLIFLSGLRNKKKNFETMLFPSTKKFYDKKN